MKDYKVIYIKSGLLVVLLAIISCQKPIDEKKSIPVSKILERIVENTKDLRSMYSSGKIEINIPGFKNSAEFEIFLKEPDSLLINIFGPFGLDVGNVLLAKDRIYFLNNLTNQFYMASADKENIKKLIKMDLTRDDLVNFIKGQVELPKGDEEGISYVPEGENYLISFLKNGKSYKYWVDIRYLMISKMAVFSNDTEQEFEFRFSDFVEESGTIVPKTIHFENKIDNGKIKILLRELKINPPKLNLEFVIPEDAEKIVL